jgi:hypothetical protein
MAAALACLTQLAFASAGAVQGAPARPTNPKSSPQVARFYLHGTHGYKVSVFATVEGPGSPVRIVAEDHKGGAEYRAPGTVTPSRIQASFGHYGEISLRFHPSGQVLRSDISDDKECPSGAKARIGTFTGSFRFRGEDAYTAVNVHRMEGGVGAPTAPIDHREEISLGCPNANRTYIVSPGQVPQSFEEDESATAGMTAVASAPGEAIIFAAAGFSLRHSEKPGAKPESCLFAALTEEARESIQIARVVFGAGPGSECLLDRSLGSLTVTPAAPFSGTATLRLGADGTTSWTGSLAVPFPGRGTVSLAGPSFESKLSGH